VPSGLAACKYEQHETNRRECLMTLKQFRNLKCTCILLDAGSPRLRAV
jgi:hypothetical protein